MNPSASNAASVWFSTVSVTGHSGSTVCKLVAIDSATDLHEQRRHDRALADIDTQTKALAESYPS